MTRNSKKQVDNEALDVQAKPKKVVYPKEFNYFKQEAHIKLRPNVKNTFIISKYKKDAKSLYATTHQYVSMHEIQEAGNYILKAFIVPDEYKKSFNGNIYADCAILALQSEDDETEFLPVFAVSFEAIKCPACYGSGYFKKVVKGNFASVLSKKIDTQVPAKSKLARAQGASEIHSNICQYNHAMGMGCGGTGISAAANLEYQERLEALFKFDNALMRQFLEYAQKAPKKESVFYSGEQFDFANAPDKTAKKAPNSSLKSYGKVNL